MERFSDAPYVALFSTLFGLCCLVVLAGGPAWSGPPPAPGQGGPSCSTTRFYVELDGKAQGPMECSRIQSLLAQGRIGPESLVWYPGSQGWVHLREVQALARLLSPKGGPGGGAQGPKPPPLPTQAESKTYYVAPHGHQQGPLSAGEVRSMLEKGEVTPATLAWCPGMANWSPLSSFPEFAKAAPAAAGKEEGGMPTTAEGLRRFMLGTWREVETNTEDLKVTISMEFLANGTAHYREREQEEGQPPVENMFTGFWRVEPLGKDRFKLIFGEKPLDRYPNQDLVEGTLIYIDHDHLRDATDNAQMIRVK